MVRARRPDAALAHFWHIPWPPVEIFRLAQPGDDLLRGLLANDLVGFHLPSFVDNFLRCAERLEGAEVDHAARTVRYRDHICTVGAFPISIDLDSFRDAASAPGVE